MPQLSPPCGSTFETLACTCDPCRHQSSWSSQAISIFWPKQHSCFEKIVTSRIGRTEQPLAEISWDTRRWQHCFQSESMPAMHSKWRENSAQHCHKMNLAGVDCARPLIIVYHFTAIVKLLAGECIFWYFGALLPWIEVLSHQQIPGISPACGPPPTNLWQLQTIQIVQCGFCHLFPHCLYFPFTFGCFWSEFACFSNSHSHGNKVPLFFLPGSAYILYEGAAAA